MSDLISRDAAIEAIRASAQKYTGFMEMEMYTDDDAVEAIIHLPSAEPRWIPVKSRPMDEEERAEWSEKLGYDIEYEDAVIYTSQLPDDGQEVLTCSRWGNVRIDKFENDPDYGCFFEENGDMDGIVAWMPLPEPWRGESNDRT